MPCSPAKLEANRRNALRSTGPRTDEGKERCRGNALKHGLTGRGVVLPVEDAAAVERRFAAFEQELGAEGEVGRCLARRAALMSVRLDRAAEHEAAMIARRVRVAEEEHDEERKSYVDELADGLREAPATVVRRLKSMPEGVDWLVAAWRGLKADLMNPARDVWNGGHWARAENLMGRRPGESPAPAVEAVCHATWGNFGLLDDGQGAGLTPEGRKAWAREQVAAWIDAEVEALEALRPTLDHARIAADRADAARRALFDPSPRAILARKYEGAAERGLYRALKELAALKEAEAEARAVEAEATAIEAAAVGPFFPDADAAETPAPGGDRAQAEGRSDGSGHPPEAASGGWWRRAGREDPGVLRPGGASPGEKRRGPGGHSVPPPAPPPSGPVRGRT